MTKRTWIQVSGVGWLILAAGCSQFPKQAADEQDRSCRKWKVKQNQTYDYYQYLDGRGRIVRLGYDEDGDGRLEAQVDFAKLGSEESNPHYVVMLDGIPFTLMEAMYREGRFRLFYPPRRLIAPFPSMTDLAFSEMLAPGEPLGFEALYYDRGKGRLSNGNDVYLKGANAPWQRCLDYRAAMILDPIGYVSPNFVFNHELGGIERTFNRLRCGTVYGYSVGTANVGTRKGVVGLKECLGQVDRMCEKLVYERRGRCRITILADHGHNLTASQFFDVANIVKKSGFRVTDRLKDARDVIVLEFGLVTYTGLQTQDSEAVATVLLDQDPVELAIYPVRANGEDAIVVRDRTGRARILGKGNGLSYEAPQGDPLKLKPIIEKLRASGKAGADGMIDERIWFEATTDHEYPDPLGRIWRAFHGLAQHPPDLVVTVRDGWFTGNPSFARSVNVASTHGSLNRMNSVTFVMTTIRPLPEATAIECLMKEFPEMRKTISTCK